MPQAFSLSKTAAVSGYGIDAPRCPSRSWQASASSSEACETQLEHYRGPVKVRRAVRGLVRRNHFRVLGRGTQHLNQRIHFTRSQRAANGGRARTDPVSFVLVVE